MIAHLYEPPRPDLVRPEARALVRDAKAGGHPLGILTNDMRAFHSQEWVDAMEIVAEADVLVDGSIEGHLKPDPRLYELLSERLGLDYADMAFLDDMRPNIRGAEALGIGLTAAYLQAAPAKALAGVEGAQAFDALGTFADRLARRASVAVPGKASGATLSAHLDVANGYGVRFATYEVEGRMQVCYEGEAFRRLLAMPVADAEQIRKTSPLQRAGEVRLPLLVAYGGEDRRVPLKHGTAFKAALRADQPIEWVVYGEEGHGWFDLKTNEDFWGRVERFLAKHLAPGN